MRSQAVSHFLEAVTQSRTKNPIMARLLVQWSQCGRVVLGQSRASASLTAGHLM